MSPEFPATGPLAMGFPPTGPSGGRTVPLWLDDPARPAARPALDGDGEADLVVVGGGLTGLWAALSALETDPGRDVVVLEAARLGWAASGRNGGFCAASLTHGLANGQRRWPRELPTLLRMGAENLDEIEETVARLGIDADFRRTGELTVAVEPWQVEALRGTCTLARGLGEEVQFLDEAGVRARVHSPTYLAGLWAPRSTALVNPARLTWGLAAAAERAGARVHEGTRVQAIQDDGDRVVLVTGSGRLRARRVVVGTNVFPSPLRRVRPFVVPVWDHVLATRPLTRQERAGLGWAGEEGVADAGNRFHYYRLTADHRLLWGGYDAHYYFGSDLRARRSRHPVTEARLARHLRRTFPGLAQVEFSHVWSGAIDTSTRFAPFWERAMGGKVVAVQGYTGLGVGSSRFGALVALDLLDGRETARTRLDLVRSRPVPFPPEPLRWAAIQATRRASATADRNQGRRGPWLRTLDALGLGFDS